MSESPDSPPETESKPEAQPENVGFMKKLMYGMTLVVSGLYLTYPSLGIWELIPDVLPVVGHLDEAFFFMLLLWSAARLNLPLPKFLTHNRVKRMTRQDEGDE